MEEVDLIYWHKTDVRQGVLNGEKFAARCGASLIARGSQGFTQDFLEWKTKCEGRVAVKITDIRAPFDQHIYFELKNDLTLYLLTYVEKYVESVLSYKISTQADTAMFYCPYIPLQKKV